MGVLWDPSKRKIAGLQPFQISPLDTSIHEIKEDSHAYFFVDSNTIT